MLQPLARTLQARGSLVSTEHGGLRLAGDARAILKGEASVAMVTPPPTTKRGRRAGSPADDAPDPLFDALRELRRDLAREAQVPPYVVFHDATLREMAARRPATLTEMRAIPGIGTRKLEAYGEAFLTAIRRH